MAFLLLAIGYLVNGGASAQSPAAQESCIVAGGVFGILAAFLAWYVSSLLSIIVSMIDIKQVQRPRWHCRPK